MSPELHAFYVAYAAWLDAGAPDEKPFCRSDGLCWSIEIHCDGNGSYRNLRAEMETQFKQNGLSSRTPFGGDAQFGRELDRATQHLNPARIAWVRKHTEMEPVL